ncbi:MAG: DUF4342 domain-containing protein [Bacillota bacterium]|nr:DUF4342 domain-containing protein [Bacillota bacterium]
MMATMEQVEKLRDKANVTYDEARAALEACGDDLLDAVIYLERQGKVKAPQNGGYYNTTSQAAEGNEQIKENCSDDSQQDASFSRLLKRVFTWCGRMIAKGNQNSFEVRQHERVIITIPVTILALFLLFAFWVVVPLLIVGLFFNFNYVFKGPDLEKTGVNDVMGSASNAAENLRKEVIEGRNK